MCDSFIVREDKSGIPFLLNTSVHNYLNDQPTYMTANITTEAHHARDFRDMGPAILTTATVMTSTALLMVLARLYVRLKMTRSWGLDDHCILVALMLSITGYGFIISAVLSGADHRADTFTHVQIERQLMLNFAIQPIFVWGVTFVKVSISFFLLRIAPSRFYRHFLWGAIGFLLVYTSAIFAATLVQCRPLSAAWSPDFKRDYCFSPAALNSLNYTNSCLCLITDMLFAVLPIPMLWNVQIRRRVKLLIWAIMGLGIFAAAANAVRIFYFSQYRKPEDYLFGSANLTVWATVECNTGIIAASIPCVKPLLRNFFVNGVGGSQNTNTSEPFCQPLVFGDVYFASLDSRYIFPMNPLTKFSSGDAGGNSISRDTEAGNLAENPATMSTWERSLRADLQPVRQRGAYGAGELLHARGHVNGGGMVTIRPLPEDDVRWLYSAVARELSRPHALSLARPLKTQRNPQAKESRRESLKGTDAARSSEECREHERLHARKLYAEASGSSWDRTEKQEPHSDRQGM